MKSRASRKNSGSSNTAKAARNIVNVGYLSANYYALDISDGKLLVDCGWPGSLPLLNAELKRKGIPFDQIKYLLVTHFHPDHAGLAGELTLRNVKLVLLESQLAFISDMEELFRRKKMAYQPIHPEGGQLLKFSESRNFLSKLGLAGEIISTPGHSDDSLTLILDEGYAFTGDLHPPQMVTESELETTQRSWEKIRAHPVTQIYPGHGNVFSTPPA